MQLRVLFRTSEIPRSDLLRSIVASCYLTGFEFTSLPPVNHSDITVTSKGVVALSPNSYLVSMYYEFTYDQPNTGRSLQEFQVWFNESLAPSDLSNSGDIQLMVVEALERSVFVQDIVISSDSTFDVYLQVRKRWPLHDHYNNIVGRAGLSYRLHMIIQSYRGISYLTSCLTEKSCTRAGMKKKKKMPVAPRWI